MKLIITLALIGLPSPLVAAKNSTLKGQIGYSCAGNQPNTYGCDPVDPRRVLKCQSISGNTPHWNNGTDSKGSNSTLIWAGVNQLCPEGTQCIAGGKCSPPMVSQLQRNITTTSSISDGPRNPLHPSTRSRGKLLSRPIVTTRPSVKTTVFPSGSHGNTHTASNTVTIPNSTSNFTIRPVPTGIDHIPGINSPDHAAPKNDMLDRASIESRPYSSTRNPLGPETTSRVQRLPSQTTFLDTNLGPSSESNTRIPFGISMRTPRVFFFSPRTSTQSSFSTTSSSNPAVTTSSNFLATPFPTTMSQPVKTKSSSQNLSSVQPTDNGSQDLSKTPSDSSMLFPTASPQPLQNQNNLQAPNVTQPIDGGAPVPSEIPDDILMPGLGNQSDFDPPADLDSPPEFGSAPESGSTPESDLTPDFDSMPELGSM